MSQTFQKLAEAEARDQLIRTKIGHGDARHPFVSGAVWAFQVRDGLETITKLLDSSDAHELPQSIRDLASDRDGLLALIAGNDRLRNALRSDTHPGMEADEAILRIRMAMEG